MKSIETKRQPINSNVLFIGKKGVGKSALINYLFSDSKFTSIEDVPVIDWQDYFTHKKLSFDDAFNINVYESYGLKNDNFIQWSKKLDEFLSKKQIVSYNHIIPDNDTIHVFFYVIDVTSYVIGKNEINILYDVSKNNKLPISIILTHCDLASEDQINIIEDNIKKIDKNIDIIKVCSFSNNISIDKEAVRFGKDECIQKILSTSCKRVGKFVIKNACEECVNIIIRARNSMYEKIDSSDFSTFDMEFSEGEMDKTFSPLFELESYGMEYFIPKSIISYHTAINNFDINWQEKDIFNETFQSILNAIEHITNIDFENVEKKVEANIEAIMEKEFDDVSSFPPINPLQLFRTELKKGVNEIFDKAIILLEKYV